ncbi:hypothetical protein A2U01_0118812, partial [Trifolium medium]|nr:hypothetical protein [Trifolium medium]
MDEESWMERQVERIDGERRKEKDGEMERETKGEKMDGESWMESDGERRMGKDRWI